LKRLANIKKEIERKKEFIQLKQFNVGFVVT